MTFSQLMNDLRTNVKASDLNAFVLKEWNDKSDTFWKELLEYLRNENNSSNLSNYLLRDN